jgi:hypothetical protein
VLKADNVQITLYGTISGNTITFPTGNMIGFYGSGTKVGNNLNFTLSLNNGVFGTFNAVKQ